MPGVRARLDLARSGGGNKRQNDDGTRAHAEALISHPATEGPQRLVVASGSLL
jgi:hypothetical protein